MFVIKLVNKIKSQQSQFFIYVQSNFYNNVIFVFMNLKKKKLLNV